MVVLLSKAQNKLRAVKTDVNCMYQDLSTRYDISRIYSYSGVCKRINSHKEVTSQISP